jgi:hypothetical protein
VFFDYDCKLSKSEPESRREQKKGDRDPERVFFSPFLPSSASKKINFAARFLRLLFAFSLPPGFIAACLYVLHNKIKEK